jgi:hypothetical protein
VEKVFEDVFEKENLIKEMNDSKRNIGVGKLDFWVQRDDARRVVTDKTRME